MNRLMFASLPGLVATAPAFARNDPIVGGIAPKGTFVKIGN